MAEAPITNLPDICSGCKNPLPLPPHVIEENGRLVRKHVFLCGRFAAHETSVKHITDTNCPGKELAI